MDQKTPYRLPPGTIAAQQRLANYIQRSFEERHKTLFDPLYDKKFNVDGVSKRLKELTGKEVGLVARAMDILGVTPREAEALKRLSESMAPDRIVKKEMTKDQFTAFCAGNGS